MNHSKIRVSITLPKEHVVAGRYVIGEMEGECMSDKLGIGITMVEFFGLQGAFLYLLGRDVVG